MCASRSLTGRWLYFLSGFLKKKNTTARDKPPKGRLIQKHPGVVSYGYTDEIENIQRQESLSVKAPPRIGPTTLAIPNIDDSAAM